VRKTVRKWRRWALWKSSLALYNFCMKQSRNPRWSKEKREGFLMIAVRNVSLVESTERLYREGT
jgi:hypothetical protein